MRIPDGYHDVPAGKIAAIVTYLEMKRPPERTDAAIPDGLTLRRVERPTAAWYRELFRAVGEDWLWFSRRLLPDAELEALLHDPQIELYVFEEGGAAHGMLELDVREFPDIELSFFGLTSRWIGRGAGRFLIQHGVRQAFRHMPRRFFLHTCTLDHPGAMEFYRKAGFRAYKRAIEVANDPRLIGVLPRGAAPQIPIIEGH